MPAPIERHGRPASPGIAAGPLVRLSAPAVGRAATGDAEEERTALEAAVAAAIGQLELLIERSGGPGAAILEFQAAMLADSDLIGPALAAIDAGASADAAWAAVLAEQIRSYEAADDDYFRARAADMTDLRDRVLYNLAGIEAEDLPAGAILVADDITPTRFLETDWSSGGGIALAAGSTASHVAMLARSRGVPMVVGLGPLEGNGHAEALLDGERGTIVLSPGQAEKRAFESRRLLLSAAAARAAEFLGRPAATADGTQIEVMVNIARPDEVDRLDVAACDGVGLMRTEFLFSHGLPDEEMQYRAYAKVLAWAAGRPVTIRTVDAGGDKPVPGFTVDEPNPFLGLRGVRLSLARPEVFRVQLRALARAALHGKLKIMLPMVTVPAEIDAAARLLDVTLGELATEGIPAARPPLGIMVEVPAVAIVPEAFASADFFSIGSNDLTQYVTAAARDSAHVADLNDVAHPAVMRLIGDVAAFGARAGIEVSLCGDAGGDPAHVPALLKAGLRTLSVAPAALGPVKAAIADTRLGAGHAR
jgi:phosphotransferase system enzyme I (PtsI)